MTETDMAKMQDAAAEHARQLSILYEVNWRYRRTWHTAQDNAYVASHMANKADVDTWVTVKTIVK